MPRGVNLIFPRNCDFTGEGRYKHPNKTDFCSNRLLSPSLPWTKLIDSFIMIAHQYSKGADYENQGS